VSNPQSLSKINDNKKLGVETICMKYNIKIPEPNIEEEPHEEEIANNMEENSKENNNVEEEPKEQSEKCADQIDADLREFLMQFYLKKKVSQVPFIRQGPGLYEYGTQKILIKKENDTLKGKLIDNFSPSR
jgi:hypothetical protein